MVSNGGPLAPSLLNVAMKAAVQAGAPRRTVAATAAAVASVILASGGGAGASGDAAEPMSTSQQRRAKRKKATAKAAKEAAATESNGKEPVGVTAAPLGSAGSPSASAVPQLVGQTQLSCHATGVATVPLSSLREISSSCI